MRRSREPFLWALFSGGGMLAALFFPALVFMLWIAGPLGWVESGAFAGHAALFRHPLVRPFLLALISLALFHWAHRFRYTLYDGLQLYHLNQLIAVLTYGVATGLTALSAFAVFVWL